MGKKCPDCGMNNGNDRIFCGACGEPLGGQEKLVRDLEKSQQSRNEKIKDARFDPYQQRDGIKVERSQDDGEYTYTKMTKKEEKTSNAWMFWVFLAIVVVIAFFLF